ncbi:MAG: sigma-70 family RNA polymerase sigma factor, partial [Lachnospiraceae bacterium]|nr:sigma-70 family RNA polymerase sigma factor [Lachnospiraceae bacterium]
MTDVMSSIREKDEILFSEVRKLKLGSSENFNSVYELSKNYIYKIIWDIVKNPDAVEDIMQETYLQIYNRIDTLKEVSAFYVWAGRIATNFSLAYLRKENKYVLSSAEEDEDAEGFIYEKVTDDHEVMIPETIFVNKEQQNIIRGILDGLSAEQKICVQYYYFEEMSVKEIAEQMDTSEGTVKSRLNYARKAIKSAVEKFEKEQGTKLYSLGALPILLFVYRGAIQDYIVGMAAAGATAGTTATATTATTAGTSATAATASTAGTSATAATASTAGTTATAATASTAGTAATTATGSAVGTAATAATASTATAAAGATGASAVVKALAVILTIGAIGGGGYAVHQHYVENQRIEAAREAAQEAARVEQEKQQRVIKNARNQYSHVFDMYEEMSGKSDKETADHLLNLSDNEAKIYQILNDSSRYLESLRAKCRDFMTDDQYQVMNSYFFAPYDQSVEQQIISAELIIDMNRYYG